MTRTYTAILSFTLSMVFTATSAQKSDDSWRIGLSAGMNTSALLGDPQGSFQKIGVTAGVIAYKPMGEKSSFETGLYFFQKGLRIQPNLDLNIFSDYRLSLNYLDLPLLYIYRISRLEVEVGPSLGVLITQNEEDLEAQTSQSPGFNVLEVAANAGVRWRAADNFRLGLRYHLALLPSQSLTAGGISTLRGRHNHAIVLYGAFLF